MIFAVAVAFGSTLSARTFAEAARVAVVRSTSSSPAERQALTRIQGELAAEGFDVVTVDSEGALDASASSPSGVVASIELVVDAEQRFAELKVEDRTTSKTVIRRVAVESPLNDRFAEILAVRAVELLRASLLELLLPPVRARAASSPSPIVRAATDRVTKWTAGALEARRTPTIGFDAGTAVLFGFGGIGPALLGVLRVRGALGRSFQLRATVSGLGTSPRVQAASGSASVSETLGLVELVATPWATSALHPALSVGAGPLYVAVDGQATFPYVGEQGSGWAAAFDAGAGGALRLSEHFELSLEGHAFVTRPYQVTRFLGQDGPGLGQPSFLGTLTVVGWL